MSDSPVLVHFMLEDDDVTLLEAELSGVLRLEVVECLAWWLTQLGGSRAGSVSVGRRHAWVEARAELKYFYRLKEWNIFEIKKLKYFWNLDTELFLKFKEWNIFVVAVLTCEGWWVGVPAGEPPGDIKLPLGMLLKQETVRRGQSERWLCSNTNGDEVPGQAVTISVPWTLPAKK